MEADPDNDEFNCGKCGGVFDIEESVSAVVDEWETFICEGCDD